MKKRVCIIYNFAQQYREGIFRLLDKEFDCDWFFGNNITDIKELDLSILSKTTKIKNKKFIHYPLTFQTGIIPLLWEKQHNIYLILGDMFCISTWLLLCLKKICFPHKRIYLWSHGWYGKESRFKRLLKKIYFGLADGNFLYGNYAKQLMLREGFPENKLFVIHNSLMYDTQIFLRNSMKRSNLYQEHFKNDYFNIIFIGRLTAVKKLNLLIDAIVILRQKGCNCNITFIGDGNERQKLQERVKNQQISNSVWFYGACYNEVKNAELIYNADLCVSPGNVGLTAMHTMVFGTPVITHNDFKWQMPEFEAIKPGITGDFFRAGDVYSLAETIQLWLKNNAHKRDIIRKACYKEIDTEWNPGFQIEIFKKYMK